jgi:hypothetical protein
MAMAVLHAQPAVATGKQGAWKRPCIAPINTNPGGQTYGRWATDWWQWAFGIPAAVNPFLDTTGEHCAQRQVDNFWFLAGSTSADPVVRACQIPAGKSLFFPLINIIYGAWLNDSPETRTEEFIRTTGNCSEPAQISVWIDGSIVPKPTRFFPVPRAANHHSSTCSCPPEIWADMMKQRCPSWSLVRARNKGTTSLCGRCPLVLTPFDGLRRDAPQGITKTSHTISPWSN